MGKRNERERHHKESRGENGVSQFGKMMECEEIERRISDADYLGSFVIDIAQAA